MAAQLGVGLAAQSAFAIAVKNAAAKQVERHQYYAAVVQTGGAGAGGAGYEEFLIHRPNDDPRFGPTVRRAAFGPKLRGELRRLAVEQGVGDVDVM
jgi:hypothetical protein